MLIGMIDDLIIEKQRHCFFLVLKVKERLYHSYDLKVIIILDGVIASIRPYNAV